jgi:aspartyl-tRNA(Asn)/glutamyl-tRNA(Gln) amidotransferase subunit A
MTASAELAFASIPVLGKKLRAGEFTAVELATCFLDRLECFGPRFNAVATVTRALAIEQAERADRELSRGFDRGPLHGIPFGAKDVLATRGIATTWGAAPLREQVFEIDASVIQRLYGAGAVLVAKLAMVELSGALGYRQPEATFTGPGRNPWDPESWTGGSSSGCASAVAAGLVPFAIGSETCGSIMDPAGYCGIAGLRPTYGRVSRHGAMALSWTLDKLGPLCRTARDCGLVLQAIAGHDPMDEATSRRPYRFPPHPERRPPFKLAVLTGAAAHLQPGVKENFEASLDVLRGMASVEEVELPEYPYYDVTMTIFSSEMAAAFEEMLVNKQVWDLTAPECRLGAHAAQFIPARDYINAQRIRRYIQRALDQLLSPYDALVTPTLATVAPPLGRRFREYCAHFGSATDIGAAGNAAGVPALTIPNGFGERHLPTGLQLVGRAFHENRLLAVARAYQSATRWHRQFPKIEEEFVSESTRR